MDADVAVVSDTISVDATGDAIGVQKLWSVIRRVSCRRPVLWRSSMHAVYSHYCEAWRVEACPLILSLSWSLSSIPVKTERP